MARGNMNAQRLSYQTLCTTDLIDQSLLNLSDMILLYHNWKGKKCLYSKSVEVSVLKLL